MNQTLYLFLPVALASQLTIYPTTSHPGPLSAFYCKEEMTERIDIGSNIVSSSSSSEGTKRFHGEDKKYHSPNGRISMSPGWSFNTLPSFPFLQLNCTSFHSE
ncbi:hypothetical protein BT96DRAFT_928935, partial [Gymnopus androsaceus JB14]